MDAGLSPLQLLGFLLASWAVIGNDSLQTLGPFLQANRGRTPRWLQALGLCAVLCVVLLLGWWRGDGRPQLGAAGLLPGDGSPGLDRSAAAAGGAGPHGLGGSGEHHGAAAGGRCASRRR